MLFGPIVRFGIAVTPQKFSLANPCHSHVCDHISCSDMVSPDIMEMLEILGFPSVLSALTSAIGCHVDAFYSLMFPIFPFAINGSDRQAWMIVQILFSISPSGFLTCPTSQIVLSLCLQKPQPAKSAPQPILPWFQMVTTARGECRRISTGALSSSEDRRRNRTTQSCLNCHTSKRMVFITFH